MGEPGGTDGLDELDEMDEMDEIVAEFLVESHENLDRLDQDLVALERDPRSRDLLSSVFRTLHTIKGTSGFLAFHQLEAVTHVGESLLSRLRDGAMTLTADVTTVLLEMVDAVRTLLGDIQEDGSERPRDYTFLVGRLEHLLEHGDAAPAEPESGPDPEPSPDPTPQPLTPMSLVPPPPAAGPAPDAVTATAVDEARRPVTDSTIRVDVGLLDSLMTLVGELVLTRNQIVQRAVCREDAELLASTHRLNIVAGELQEGVMKTRMQPIDTVWSKLPRVVRDLSLSLGKQVGVQMEGRDTELDKTILEAVKDPLTHLVRNAVDHGVESPEARLAVGKPAEGQLLLRAFHEGGQVNIEISDDGAGIDPERLRSKAVERGLHTPESAARLGDRELLNLIFTPGFSTAAAVTNVSGRGVGMDVVKTNIEQIGGLIDLSSTPGEGTTARIRIPLTLAIIPALVVAASGQRYAIPQVNLLELVRVEHDGDGPGIEHIHGAPVLRLRGDLLPLVHLREQLGEEPAGSGTSFIVVLQAGERQFGLVVDDIRDTEEIVVKPLGAQLRGVPLFSGATIMGDGHVVLILDTGNLAERAGMVADGGRARSGGDADGPTDAERAALLVLALADGRRMGVPLDAVDRLEVVPTHHVENAGGREVVQYRDAILPLLRLDSVYGGQRPHLAPEPHEGAGAGTAELQVVICRTAAGQVGLVAHAVVDIVDVDLTDGVGLTGPVVVGGRVTELVDVAHLADVLAPGPTARRPLTVPTALGA